MKSAELKQIDRQLYIHEQAFANMLAKATRKSGKHTKSAYRNFKDFFDYEKEIKKAKGEIVEEKVNDRFSDLAKFISKKAQRKE